MVRYVRELDGLRGEMLKFITEQNGAKTTDLVEKFGKCKVTVHYHMRILVKGGYIKERKLNLRHEFFYEPNDRAAYTEA